MRVWIINQRTSQKLNVSEQTFNQLSKKTFVNPAGQKVPLFIATGDVQPQASQAPAATQKKKAVVPVATSIKIIAEKMDAIESATTIDEINSIIKDSQDFNVLIVGYRKKEVILLQRLAAKDDELTALHNGMKALNETNKALNATNANLQSKPVEKSKNPNDKTT